MRSRSSTKIRQSRRSQLQLGVAQLGMKITTSGRREVEHIPERIEGIVVSILLARLGRHVKDFRTPEMTDRFAVAAEYVEHWHVPFLTRFEFLLHANVGRQTRRVAEIVAVIARAPFLVDKLLLQLGAKQMAHRV